MRIRQLRAILFYMQSSPDADEMFSLAYEIAADMAEECTMTACMNSPFLPMLPHVDLRQKRRFAKYQALAMFTTLKKRTRDGAGFSFLAAPSRQRPHPDEL